jgi:hypothetical protein
MIYNDENIKISFIIVRGKKELAIDYYRAGYFLGRMVTDDLNDINKITLKLADK